MNKQQWKDAEQCEQMAEQGKNKDCLGCSCNVCLAQVSTSDVPAFKEQLFEKLELLQEDIPHCTSTDEMFGAKTMLDRVVKLIQES